MIDHRFGIGLGIECAAVDRVGEYYVTPWMPLQCMHFNKLGVVWWQRHWT